MQPRRRLAPVVSTRLRAPNLDGGLISRERLIDLLQAGRDKRLALIHGPAGFGKTTLAAQWQRVLSAEGVPVAWITLGRDDNDTASFLGHLVEAVRRVEPSVGAGLGGLLEQESDDAQRYVLTELVNQCAEYGRPVAVVLDDWHLIEDEGATAVLESLLDVGPANLHLIVTTRTRGPAIARLKVRKQVHEIDAMQLRFDQKESAAFLLELNALELNGDDVHTLWSSTEGWVAALQLATLSLRSSPDPSALIRDFSGRHHSIGDYLAENVLDTLPPDLLDFLLTTSICERLCGGLAAAVSGRTRGQTILEDLERRDLFLRPLDDNREWFRYHHLFAGYLRQRLERDHGERIVVLHRTASAWFAEHGLYGEAVAHALSAGDAPAAVDLVERQAMSLVEHSRMATLLALVNKLPRHLLAARPNLHLAIAWANCLLQRRDQAQVSLNLARAAQGCAPAGVLGEADVVQACIDVYGDRIDRAAELVAPYLVENSGYRPFLVAVSANISTFVDLHNFAYDSAEARQRWAAPFHEATAGPFAGVYGRCFAGLAAFARVDLVSAERHYSEAWDVAQHMAGQHSHAARLAGALLGRVLYENGDIDSAETLLEECHELGAESGVADFMIATYSTLARIKVLRGDIEEAMALLEEGISTAHHLSMPRLAAALHSDCLRLHLAVGDVSRAQDALARSTDDIAPAHDGIAFAVRYHQRGMQARILRAKNDFEGACRVLSAMRDDSKAVGWRYGETATTIKLAKVLYLSGNTAAATDTLVPALITGARAGLIRTVVDTGPEILSMVARLREASRTSRQANGFPEVPPTYLSRLLATAHSDARSAAIPVIARVAERSPLPEEPLSAREVDILRLLDRGLSNKQIARNLGVTINTVKWYLKSIYIKLGVGRRGESIAEARRRRILP
ncbi:LuxR C-terminal-related transcriptional regulator [Mycobacterium sp. CVI_P3]|uniref:LuxR C-terminal-related transcriptional regulator n=1 Tax=Mycobacterium pinniadriaticum TaxID=2994102 RepID=A0ABT3SM57_9MYCO|nr:LuxR C-terminal-related transcriptional regulator [Mycobacterium pinniadriaticum]MCX2933821.1 LuxR C-terminal-related transcriptional regulator [Mycobacterium pinniadriaticum]MCX2940243.1 LuxR C-terminal-related transcriptional regulator [Mycobacterium pinniadriaticum]